MINLKINTIDKMIQKENIDFLESNESKVYSTVMLPLYEELKKNSILQNNTIEVLAKQMILDPMQPFLNFNDIRKSNKTYISKELDWYLSQDLSIINHVDDIKIWNAVCTKDSKKEVNSNYGWLVFNKANGSQYENCLKTLINDKYTRNAIIMYNRPNIYTEYLRDGMHDMICTIFSHFFIRNNQLEMIHIMRSNDLIFGFINDFAWNCFVYQNMYLDLKDFYPELNTGHIYWQSDSMHVYERHFDTLEKIVNSYSFKESKND